MNVWKTACVVAVGVLAGGCAAPPRPTPHQEALARFTGAARRAFDAGEPAQALRHYLQALNEARAADDGPAVADAAYNAAVCCVALKAYRRAEALLEEALLESRRLSTSPVRILLVQAVAARAQKRWQVVDHKLRQAEEALGGNDAPEARTRIWLLRALSACDRNEPGEARSALGEARAFLAECDNALLKAEASAAQGSVLMLEGAPLRAAGSFDHAAALYRRAGKYKNMAYALSRAARAYLKAGRQENAVDRAYRSARSYKALGHTARALVLIKEVLPPRPEKEFHRQLYAPLLQLFKDIERELAGQAAAPREASGEKAAGGQSE